MSKTVDSKVVEMRFDNKNFEKNVKTSMSTLDKLKNALKLDGASKGLEDLERKANSLKFQGLANTVEHLADKFSGLQMAGTLAMYKIANAAADAGIRMVKSLSTDNIISGWNKLQQKANSMSTLISQGYKTEVVEEQLEKLNWFSDETSYNFTDMIDNIAKFTATGKGLEDSVTAMQGIALWAAKSGQNAQKASMAMYQLSQALGSGTMRKEDWKSIQNANMDTDEFRQQAIETAIELKTLKKVGQDTYQSLTGNKETFKKSQFADSLTEGAWFTSDVMMAVYKKYAKASDQMKTAIDKMSDDYGLTLTASQMIKAYDSIKEGTFDSFVKEAEIDEKAVPVLKEMVSQLDEFGIKAFRAGQEYRTFNDVIDATKDAVSTKWMNIFETLIGNIDKQKELWSTIGEQFYEWFASPLDNLQELLNRWVDKGGRDSLWAGLGNIGSAISAIVTPIKEAWNDIFPPMTAKRLVELTKRFEELTSKLIIGEKTASAIKSSFKGAFSVVKTGIHIVGLLVKAVFNIIGALTPLLKGVILITGTIAKYTEKVSDAIRKSNFLANALNKVVDAVKFVTQGITNFVKEAFKVDRVTGFFKGVFTFISKICQNIAKAIGQFMKDNNVKSAVDLLNGGMLATLIIGLKKFVNNLTKITDKAASFKSSILDILGGVKDVLSAYQKEINAKTLMKIAQSIAILVGSLFVLSLIDKDKLLSSLGSMSVVIAELMIAMNLFTKIAKKFEDLKGFSSTKATMAMIGISASVLILASALKKISGLSLKELGIGLLGIAAGLGIMIAALRLMPDPKKTIAKTSSLIGMATALVVLSFALKNFAKMSFVDIGKSLLAMTGSLTIMVTALNKMNPDSALRKSLSLLIAVNALMLLGAAMHILADLSWSDIGRGLTAMAGALFILTKAMNAMNAGDKSVSKMGFIGIKGAGKSSSVSKQGGAIGKSVGLLGATMSLIVLGGAMKILATMSWSDIGRALTAMAGALVSLTLVIKILGSSAKTAFTGAGALIIAANALVVLALGLKILGSMSVGSIAKSLVTLALAFTVLGVAGKLLSGIALPLLAVAGAMALFGVGAMAFGAGLILIASGIGALALALAGGATSIIAGITAIILGIAGTIPELIKIAGSAIVAFCQVIIDSAPMIATAIGTVLLETVKMFGDYIPLVANAVFDFLIKTLRVVADRLPELIISAMEVAQAFFKGFVEALDILDANTLLTGIKCIALLSTALILMAGLTLLAPAAVIGILAFGVLVTELTGVLSLVGSLFKDKTTLDNINNAGDILAALGGAIGKFVGAIISGLASGLTRSLPDVATNLSQFMENIQPFLNGSKNIDMAIIGRVGVLSGAILLLAEANIITGITRIFSLGQSLPKLGSDLSQFMINLDGFLKGSSKINPSIVQSVGSVAAAIMTLTAANLLNNMSQFMSIFTGGNSLAKFGGEIESLGTSIKNFATNLGTFNDSQLASVKCACDAVIALSNAAKKIPNSGGVAGFFAGENDIDVWGSKLPKLAKGLSEFVKELGEFSDPQIKTAECAAKCVTVMSEAASKIPNSGGIKALFSGDNDISDFGTKLGSVATNLKDFVTNLGEFSDSQIKTAECAAKVITVMANAASEIPKTGGMKTLFTGDNDISEFGDKLPGVATNLTGFITNLGDFGEAQLNTAKCASEVLATMAKAAKDLPRTGGIKLLFTGDNDISTFGAKLPGIATYLANFITNVGKVDSDSVNTANCAANIIATMAHAASEIPNSGGLKQLFTGDNDITGFGNNLPTIATNLKDFITNLGEFGEANIATADCAAKVITTMAQTASEIPKTGGLKQLFTGENDISEFGAKLPGVATNLSQFIKNLGTFESGQLETVKTSAEALKALANAGANVPKTGGLKQLFTGDNDIASFANKLPGVASGINGYITNLGDFTEKKIATVTASTEAIKAICELDKCNVDNTSKVAGELSNKLAGMGENLAKFANAVSGTDKDKLSKAIENTTSIINMMTSAANLNVDSLNTFTESLKSLGENSVTGFIEAFSGESPKNKVSQAMRDLIDKMITTVETKREDLSNKFTSLISTAISKLSSREQNTQIEEAGKNFVQGFANGINNNKYIATNAASDLGKSALEAARKSIDSHSPSKKSFKLGGFFGMGFINGIKQYTNTAYDESYSMGTYAKNGLTKAIATVNNLLNGTNGNQPTIRPVLDLSDVQKGANGISSMFNNVGIGANLNAISVGMKQRSQNGVNDDVVSAIDRLGSNLGSNGDTYNINGISYSGDSDVANAINTLIRAINIEGRS